MGQPTFNQITHRIRDDDGNETGATWLAVQGADYEINVDTKFRVRFLIDEQNVKAWTGVNFLLYYSKNGGSFSAVTGSTPIQFATSTYYTDGDDCTSQLTGGTGTFVTDNNGMDQDASVTNTGAINQYFECEFCLLIDSAQNNDADYFNLRVYTTTGAINSYIDEPVITANVPAGGDSIQANYRVRLDEDALNSETSGWLAALNNSPSTIDAEVPFRIRFEVVASGGSVNKAYQLRVDKNGGGYNAIATTRPDDETTRTATNGVEAWPTSNYASGAATTNLLSGSGGTFIAGEGVEGADNLTASINLADTQHTEVEFCVMIHKFFDGPSINTESDVFSFRLYDSGGNPLTTYTYTPSMTLNWPDYLIGGCFPENPDFVVPIEDSNGNWYFCVEYAETEPAFVMCKSTDKGKTWTPLDTANRPTQHDMEGWSACITSDGVIHILHQGSSGSVYYHEFYASDHASTQDVWGTTDTLLETNTTSDQYCCLVPLSDGRIRGFWYGNSNNPRYGTKASGGSWSVTGDIDSGADFEQVTAILSPTTTDLVYIFYKDSTNGTILMKTLTSGGTLSGSPTTVASSIGTGTSGSSSQPILIRISAWDDSGNEKFLVVYKKSNDFLYANLITNGTPGTEVQASDNDVDANAHGGSSSMAAAGSFFDPNTLVTYIIYCDNTPQYTWFGKSGAGVNTWTDTDTQQLAFPVMWVRGDITEHNGKRWITYVYDRGNESIQGGQGTGYIWLDEIEIATLSSFQAAWARNSNVLIGVN